MVSKERIDALKQIASQSYVSRITTLELREVFEYYEAQKEPKLVVLPVKMAEAIEYYKNGPIGFTKYGIIDTILNGIRKEDKEARQELIALNNDDYPDILLEALINGYTVETLESKINAGVREIFDDWCVDDDKYGPEVLTQRITNFVTQVIREEQS